MKTPRPVTELHPVRPIHVGDWVLVRKYSCSSTKLPGPCRVVGIDREGTLPAYCVEFIESDPMLHDGRLEQDKPLGRDRHCWWVGYDDIEPLPMDLCIFHEGDKTYCLRGDKRRVSGTATFARTEEAGVKDDLVGAVIAMARAYDRNPTEVAWKVLKAMSHQPGARSIINDTEPVSAEMRERVKVLENNYDELWEKIDLLEDWSHALADEQETINGNVEALRARVMYLEQPCPEPKPVEMKPGETEPEKEEPDPSKAIRDLQKQFEQKQFEDYGILPGRKIRIKRRHLPFGLELVTVSEEVETHE